MTKLSAPLALKKYIVECWYCDCIMDTDDDIEREYALMHEQIGCDVQQDIMGGKWETNIPPAFSRHCETESVAVKDNYGNYIGFTRYYGGGKHFDEYSWYDTSIENAYYLTCKEKEVLTIERTWTKV